MAGFTRKGINKLSLALRTEVREMLRPSGIEVIWVDTPAELPLAIERGTNQRWIEYRKQQNRMLKAVKSLVSAMRRASEKGQVVASGPFLYERDIQAYWWCDYGQKAK